MSLTPPKYLQSFGRTKSRKLRDNAKRLLDEVLPKVLITNFPDFKQKPKETWLEIGFGDGGHLLHQALNNRDIAFIGCEPFINGTVKLLRGIEENGLTNIHVSNNDFRLIAEKFPKHSIDRVFILFPDPWPKKKQNKRRIISTETLNLLANIMKPGATLRVATDHMGYAEWIISHVLNHPQFTWPAKSKASWQQPADHIETKYQMKNLAKSAKPVFFEFKAAPIRS